MVDQGLSISADEGSIPSAASKRPDRLAILRIAPEVLSGLLQLPEVAYIDWVSFDDKQLGVMLLRIRGAGWEVMPGFAIPQVSPMLTTHFDAEGGVRKVTIEWGFPDIEGDG